MYFVTITLNSYSNLVRHSASRVVAAIASIEIPAGNWPQLLPFLQQTSTSSNASHREVGMYMLYTALENIVEGFQDHLGSLFQLFSQTLADPDSIEVRITTVRFVASCIGFVKFYSKLHRAMGVIAQFIDSDDKAFLVSENKNTMSRIDSLLKGSIPNSSPRHDPSCRSVC